MISDAAHHAPLRQRIVNRVYRWWLLRFRYCFDCDRQTILTHTHHDVHPNLRPWWAPR